MAKRLGHPTFVTAVARHAWVEDGKARKGPAVASAKAACEQIKQKLDGRKPQLYYVTENMWAPQEVNEVLKAELADAPFAGVANNWQDYSPNDRDSFAEMEAKMAGISITAILGDVEVQAETVEFGWDPIDWAWGGGPVYGHYLKQRPDHMTRAAALVQKFKFGKGDGEANILIVSGAMHTLRHEYVIEGIDTVLPEGVLVAGGATADWGSVYYKGKVHEFTLLGVRITGRYRVIATGCKAHEDAPDRLKELLEEVNGKLGGAAPTAMVFFSCAGGWRHSFGPQGNLLKQYLPAGLGMIGQISGGEFGKLRDTTGNVGDKCLGVMLVMTPGP